MKVGKLASKPDDNMWTALSSIWIRIGRPNKVKIDVDKTVATSINGAYNLTILSSLGGIFRELPEKPKSEKKVFSIRFHESP